MVTEVGTGLGLLGATDLDQVLAERPAVMRSLSPEDWDQLALLRAGGSFDADFHAAWENGRTFLAAHEGLRGRPPAVVEWKGAIRAPGDEVAPVDLRVDHVYLISCKYLSNILFNVSPTQVFDHLLVGGPTRRSREATRDWYAEVAPAAYQELYAAVRAAVCHDVPAGVTPMRPLRPAGRDGASLALPGLEPAEMPHDGSGTRPESIGTPVALGDLPDRAVDLNPAQRSALSARLSAGWPAESKAAYVELSAAVAHASAVRWQAALAGGSAVAESMLWRLLRIGATPYFVLGSSTTRSLRLRIATSWDWRQLFALRQLEVFPQSGGQPRVGWAATVRTRASGEEQVVTGHVEVRWSHGRFGGLPEAKGYLDTAHQLVPGYFALQ
jgi:hypothetical protein